MVRGTITSLHSLLSVKHCTRVLQDQLCYSHEARGRVKNDTINAKDDCRREVVVGSVGGRTLLMTPT